MAIQFEGWIGSFKTKYYFSSKFLSEERRSTCAQTSNLKMVWHTHTSSTIRKSRKEGLQGSSRLPMFALLAVTLCEKTLGLSITCPSPNSNGSSIGESSIGSQWGTLRSPFSGAADLPAIEVPMVFGTSAAKVSPPGRKFYKVSFILSSFISYTYCVCACTGCHRFY